MQFEQDLDERADKKSVIFWGIILGLGIVLLTSAFLLHVGSRDELDFPAMVGSNNHQGTLLLGALSFALGILLAWNINPALPKLSILYRLRLSPCANNEKVTRRVLVGLWIAIGFICYSLWDPFNERFSLKRFVTIEEALESQKDCYREGLLGKATYRGGDFYVNGVAVGSMTKIDEQTYSLTLSVTGKKFLLVAVQETEGRRRIGVRSELDSIGILICRR